MLHKHLCNILEIIVTMTFRFTVAHCCSKLLLQDITWVINCQQDSTGYDYLPCNNGSLMASRYPAHIIMALLVTTGMGWIDRQHEGIIRLTALELGLSGLMMSNTNAGYYSAHNVHKKYFFSTKLPQLKVNLVKKKKKKQERFFSEGLSNERCTYVSI